MGQVNELSRLEQFVEKLLEKYDSLKKKKFALEEELAEKNRQIEELRSNLSSSDMRQTEVSQRLGNLVARIEEWEKAESGENDSEVSGATARELEPAAEEGVDEQPAELEGAEVVAEDDVVETVPESDVSVEGGAEPEEGKEDGRVQHNLFSLGGS